MLYPYFPGCVGSPLHRSPSASIRLAHAYAMELNATVPPGNPHMLLPPATATSSMPLHRFPTGRVFVLFGMLRQTWGLADNGKSMFNGSRSVNVFPLTAVISS